MSTMTTKDGTLIYDNDWGTGQPMVFSHDWALSVESWSLWCQAYLRAYGVRSQYCSLKKNSVRPELVEGFFVSSWWFDKLTTNG